ncbi:YozE family protein [Streptomyces sp. NPDC048191]|uniref:YozE family protein n=1 Tax=Streptomyces sp. NPDC048191 TaxID=3155484 RepID=UPI0033FEBB1A
MNGENHRRPATDFTTWLQQFQDTDTPTGAIARVAVTDPNWPNGARRLHAYTDHLENNNASPATLGNLLDAWVRWASESKQVS